MMYPSEALTYAWFINLFVALLFMATVLTLGAVLGWILEKFSGWIKRKRRVIMETEIKDSGNRTEFKTGAVRDIQDDKGRCDLLPLDAAGFCFRGADGNVLKNIGIFMGSGEKDYLVTAIQAFCAINNWTLTEAMLEVSMHYKQGEEKYGERNWEKGIPLHSYIDSGVRHFLKHIDGQEDERHDRAFVWNMLGAMWTMEHKPEMIDIPFDILGGKQNETSESL